MNKINLKALRIASQSEISKLSEVVQRYKLHQELKTASLEAYNGASSSSIRNYKHSMSIAENRTAIDAGLITFLLHCEARIISSLGHSYYTIGPCGEELLSSVSLSLRPTDASALHYRHVSTAISRQLLAGKSIEEIVLDRARGFTCSTLDPVTGGKHCAIGGSDYDFIVTSTLASQAPPAVGRAIAIPLSNKLHTLQSNTDIKFPKDAISYVTVGDGSVNNAHFLSSINLARYSQHRGMKCPVVFGISDNDRCISLRGYQWIRQFVKQYSNDISTYIADGLDIHDVYSKSREAIEHARSFSRPSILLIENLPRRFGHAATDRQIAYMTEVEIAQQAASNPLGYACADAVEKGVYSYAELVEKFDHIKQAVEDAFDAAVLEPKISSREDLILSNCKPLSEFHITSTPSTPDVRQISSLGSKKVGTNRPDSMRKNMTRFYEEVLTSKSDAIYIGEDVRHGGYYLVTEGLAAKFPARVIDFPPDETTLVGAGMGFSQAGLLPIVEIPYAKYLDCASDIFNEAIITNWLTNGKQTNGMVVRLQGFDKGVFGGNFHTHNSINIPPGLDVVCYSNGRDYVKGMRYALKQAKRGRVVMSVDSTDLLNRRHLTNGDDKWLFQYPVDTDDELTFDQVVLYKNDANAASADGVIASVTKKNKNMNKNIAIITYGNGVPTALLALHLMDPDISKNTTVIDCPYLSATPKQLVEVFEASRFSHVIFADCCKESSMPLTTIALSLKKKGFLNMPWSIIGAANTYNPLSRTLTFLSEADIAAEVTVVTAIATNP